MVIIIYILSNTFLHVTLIAPFFCFPCHWLQPFIMNEFYKNLPQTFLPFSIFHISSFTATRMTYFMFKTYSPMLHTSNPMMVRERKRDLRNPPEGGGGGPTLMDLASARTA